MIPQRRVERSGLLLVLLALVAACSGGGGPSEAPPPIAPIEPATGEGRHPATVLSPGSRGGTVVTALHASPRTLNWVAASDTVTQQISHLLSDSLVFNDARLELVPKLARSWELSEDGLTLTFRMRDDARWEDGVPVTSEDVIYTYESVLAPGSGAENLRAQFVSVASVTNPDPYTVVVRYREPYAPALPSWNIALLPAHAYRDQPDPLDNPLARRPLSCGPWKLVSWDPAREMILEPNPDYYLGVPGPERLVIQFISEFTTRFQALKRGELHLDTLTPILRREARGDAEFLERFRLESYYVLFVFYIGWNGDGSNPHFGDARVRRAMTLALDRQAYADGPFFGQVRVATSTFHPAQFAFHEGLEPWPYDPAEARRLLDAAGYADADGDGVLEREGRPFRFEYLYPSGIEENRRMAAWVRNSLSEIGVHVDLSPLPWPALLERLKEHRFEAVSLGLRMEPDPDYFDLWHSSQIEAGVNRVAYRDAEMDRLLEEGRRSLDREERKRIYRRVQEILHRDQPWTFLFHPASTLAISRSLEGVDLSPRGALLFWPGANAWWLSSTEAP
jgi:peptide/nickel transport system substrate-binding protein